MYRLPTEIEIGGIEYPIAEKGDFRMILNVFSVLDDIELQKEERLMLALCIFYDLDSTSDIENLPDIEEATEKMFKFFNADRPEDKSRGLKLVDWEKDSAIISSAVTAVAGRDVRQEDYLHWWTFMSYYMAVGESTLTTVVSIRDKIAKNKKLEKWENSYRAENPQYFSIDFRSVEDRENEKAIFDLWNSGE